jgi:hypothetical protein
MIRPYDSWARSHVEPELYIAVVQAERHKISNPSFMLTIVKD